MKKKSLFFKIFDREFKLGLEAGFSRASAFEARNKKIVSDYKKEHPVEDLARKYNLTVGRINQILLTYHARQPKWHKTSKERRRKIFQLGRKGLSKAEIGRQIGVSRERVRQILEKI